MSSKSLVLVVGAGASKEVRLPVGNELKQEIARALDIDINPIYIEKAERGDQTIYGAFRILAKQKTPHRIDVEPYLNAAKRIREAMPQAISIDNFIDSHRKDELIAICGKLAIARCILAAESRSSLMKVPRDRAGLHLNFAGVQDTWFNAFFQLLTENCQADEVPARLARIAIISFNYDRCIEHYLYEALQNYYGITAQDAAKILSALEVFHPYGKVGNLPWQTNGADGGQRIDYGQNNLRAESLLDVAKEIRTFTEGVDPQHSDILKIQQVLAECQRTVFLGFAYHRLNLELLFKEVQSTARVSNRQINGTVYGTAHGISESDLLYIKRELRGYGYTYIDIGLACNLRDLKCAELLREYGRSLSLQS